MGEKLYYIRDRGKVRGPFDLAGLQALRDRGQLSSFHEISENRQTWRSASSLAEVFSTSGHARPVVAAPAEPGTVRDWYYVASDGQQRGPMTRRQLKRMRQEGAIDDLTLVWREGMSDWQSFRSGDRGPPLDPGDPFAMIGAVRREGGMGRDVDRMLWYDANKKSAPVAFLLWWFVGLFGAHRFYLANSGSATIMLALTLVSIPLMCVYVGFFILFAVSVWWLIDAFLIPDMVCNYNNRLIGRLG
jgi:TM2 domain-containing membrane protein YozV